LPFPFSGTLPASPFLSFLFQEPIPKYQFNPETRLKSKKKTEFAAKTPKHQNIQSHRYGTEYPTFNFSPVFVL